MVGWIAVNAVLDDDWVIVAACQKAGKSFLSPQPQKVPAVVGCAGVLFVGPRRSWEATSGIFMRKSPEGRWARTEAFSPFCSPP